jgi:hypothetical protein
MEIVVLDTPDGRTIGWEIQFRQREGRFVLADDGDCPLSPPIRDGRGAEGCRCALAHTIGGDRCLGGRRFWSALAEQTVHGLL